MSWYQYQGEQDKAMDTGLNLVFACSSDGWHRRINRRVGDVCAENKRRPEAKQQYQIALQGVRRFLADEAARNERLYEAGEISKPPGFVSWQQQVSKVYEE